MGSSVPKSVSRPQTPILWSFLRLHDWIDSSYNSEEYDVLFVKIGARVIDVRLDLSSEPNWPKCSF